MSTPTAQPASQVIADSLVAINVIRETQTPSAEQQAKAIRVMNQMMAMWEADGKALGYIPIGGVTDTLTVPDGAVFGITYNLAIMLAGDYGAEVSADLAAKAIMGMAVIDKLTISEVIPDLDLPRPAYLPPTFNIVSGL